MAPSLMHNRWYRLLSIPSAVFFCSTWYYGWQYLYRFLIDAGTFSWKCDICTEELWPNFEDGVCYPAPEMWESESGDEIRYVCLEQENAVQSLYTIMSSMEFIGGLAAGLLYDLVGFRVSLLLGYALHLIGIFGVCQSTKSVPLYHVGAICAGLAVNINAYPGYFIKGFFPNNADTTLLVMFSAQWAGSVVMLAMEYAYEAGGLSLQWGQLLYSLIGIPFVINYYFILPKNFGSYRKELAALGRPVDPDRPKPQLNDIITAFKQWDIPAFCFLWYTPLVMANNAYFTCVAVLAGSDVSETLGWIQVFQFLVCLGLAGVTILGAKSTFFRWLPYGLVLGGTLVGLLSLLVGDAFWWQLLAAFIFILGNTYLYSTKYVYVHRVVDEAIYGTVCGIISICAGALQMTNILWRRLLIDHLEIFISVYTVLTIWAIGLGIVLFLRVHKNKNPHLMWIVSSPPDVDGAIKSIEDGHEPKGKNVITSSEEESSEEGAH